MKCSAEQTRKPAKALTLRLKKFIKWNLLSDILITNDLIGMVCDIPKSTISGIVCSLY